MKIFTVLSVLLVSSVAHAQVQPPLPAGDYRFRMEMAIDGGGVGNWTSTGHEIVFTTAPADLETIMEAWYVHLCALSGASNCDGGESGVEAWALDKIRGVTPAQ